MKKREYHIASRVFGIVMMLLVSGTVTAEAFLLCLGSFSVPKHEARYTTTLIDNGIPAVSYSTRVGDEMMYRVVYAVVYRKVSQAVAEIPRLQTHATIRSAGIDDIWILRLPDTEAAAILSLLPTVAPMSMASAVEANMAVPEPEKIVPDTPRLDVTVVDIVTPVTSEPEATETATTKPPVSVPVSEEQNTPESPDPPSEIDSYTVIHAEGYANCIFAVEPIELGREAEYTLKTVFTQPEPVYARCYLPGPVGETAPGDFWHEIWIDGKMRMRTSFTTAIDPSWDQIQVWITEDEYKDQMDALDSGEHRVILWVMKNEFHGERAVAGTNAAGEIEAKMEEVWIPVRLSKGSFTYIVP